MVGSYDPELNLVYWGTGVTAPLPETLRGSGKTDLLYTNSTLALDPDTGEMAWYFQLFAPRQLGPRSAVRANHRADRSRPESGGRAVDQPSGAVRRGPKGHHRYPW